MLIENFLTKFHFQSVHKRNTRLSCSKVQFCHQNVVKFTNLIAKEAEYNKCYVKYLF